MRCSVARGPRFFKWKMLRDITLSLDGMLLSDWMVWCGSGCVPWSFDARLFVDTFDVERSVTHHSISQL